MTTGGGVSGGKRKKASVTAVGVRTGETVTAAAPGGETKEERERKKEEEGLSHVNRSLTTLARRHRACVERDTENLTRKNTLAKK